MGSDSEPSTKVRRCAALWVAKSKTTFYERGSFTHLAGLWLLWQREPIEYGAARNIRSSGTSSSVLAVKVVASERKQKQVKSQSLEKEVLVTAQETAAETKEMGNPAKQVSENVSFQGYFPAGRLTRLPDPITDIDLNITSIDEVALEGEIELTILIDIDGIVVDVSTSVDQGSARVFADRVATCFRSTRFTPGEINGKAVRSQLKIKIVSEPSSQPAAKRINSEGAMLGH